MSLNVEEELYALLDKFITYKISNVHTAFPCVVKSYDATKRRANLIPSIKRKLRDKLTKTDVYTDLPVLVNVPVLYFGTSEGGIHIPLKKGDCVLVIFSECCLDKWKITSGSGIKEEDPRRFSIADAICIPGLQAFEFPNIKDLDCFALHHDKKIVITSDSNKISIGDGGLDIKDKYGIRIEDLCIMTDSGLKVLTSSDDCLICI